MTEQSFSELISEASDGAIKKKPDIADTNQDSYFDTLQLLFRLLHTVSDHDGRLFLAGWTHTPGRQEYTLKILYLPEIQTPALYIKADWGILANVPDDTTFYWELDN